MTGKIYPSHGSDRSHPETIDWNAFWQHADAEDREGATPSAAHVRDLLAQFFDAKGIPESFASVGCGPGVVAFDVADTHPETSVYGYDAAASIVAADRERAADDDVANATFEQAALPDFDPGRQFETVLCYGTLCYVEDSAAALAALYDAVAPGGHLVLGYVNDGYRRHLQRILDDPVGHGKDPDGFDRAAFEQRWQLVLDGESTLTYDAIHDAVGTWPRSFREVADYPEERWAWEDVPIVWLPNPPGGATSAASQNDEDAAARRDE